jgi:hypothetical protein
MTNADGTLTGTTFFPFLLNGRVKNMIHCTAQLCRLGQGDVASLDDDTYEISDEAFPPQCEMGIAADKWLATETAHVEQMKREVICVL